MISVVLIFNCLSSGILINSKNGISLSVNAAIRPSPYWSCTSCQLIWSPRMRAIKPLGVNKNAKPTAKATCGRAMIGANKVSSCFHQRLCQHDCKMAKLNKAAIKVLAILINNVSTTDCDSPGQANSCLKPVIDKVY